MQTAAAATSSPPGAPAGVPQREPRFLAMGRGSSWWGEGWRVFKASPGLWIGILIVLVAIMLLLNVIPFLGQLVFMLVWPVFAGGLMVGCHALARGQPLQFGHLFAGFQDGRFGPLVVLALLYVLFSAVLAVVVGGIAFLLLGGSIFALMLSGDPSNLGQLASLGVGIVSVIGIAMLAGLAVAMCFWLAPPLVALSRETPWNAVKKSWSGCWNNVGAMVVYGLIYIGLAIVASIPFGLGWLVLAPVTIGSLFATWREIYGE